LKRCYKNLLLHYIKLQWIKIQTYKTLVPRHRTYRHTTRFCTNIHIHIIHIYNYAHTFTQADDQNVNKLGQKRLHRKQTSASRTLLGRILQREIRESYRAAMKDYLLLSIGLIRTSHLSKHRTSVTRILAHWKNSNSSLYSSSQDHRCLVAAVFTCPVRSSSTKLYCRCKPRLDGMISRPFIGYKVQETSYSGRPIS